MRKTQDHELQTQGRRDRAQEPDESTLRRRMQEIGFKLLIVSGKGGVGKSTVAANLAVLLARAGKRVGLLDVDVHGPSIPHLFGLKGHSVRVDGGAMLPVNAGGGLSLMSIGFVLAGQADPVIWRGPMKHGAIKQFLTDVNWGPLDYLVVDSPPGTGDEPLSVAQLVGSPTGALIVTTPQDLAISDVRRCISFCSAVSLPVIGVVENMSGFVCPHCGEKADLFKTGGGKALAEEMQVPFLGAVPIDPQIVVSGDSGRPCIESCPDSAATEAFADIAGRILDRSAKRGETASITLDREEKNRMKIAVPVADGRLTMHFGHCEEFALLDVDRQTRSILSTVRREAPPHEPGLLPRWLRELGVDVVIAGGMGRRAQDLFAQNGIEVVVGADAETPEQLASAYLDGTLQMGENVCDH
ncbi:MAG TPA: iron-sulfur cluster carrier protein MrpORP [Sumerlaeia bacterium]|nr:iron-sulfur cluster carrier protein MrpORP [Sumerlaeia bacterium]